MTMADIRCPCGYEETVGRPNDDPLPLGDFQCPKCGKRWR